MPKIFLNASFLFYMPPTILLAKVLKACLSMLIFYTRCNTCCYA